MVTSSVGMKWLKYSLVLLPACIALLFLSKAVAPIFHSHYDSVVDAAKEGNLFAVKSFVWADETCLSQTGKNGNSALGWAILNGHNDVAVYLLDQGLSMEPAGQMPMVMYCTSRYHPESTKMLEIFLKRGANPNAEYPAEKWLVLTMAVNNGMEDKVRLLVKYGADLSKKDGYGQTAMDVAKEMLALVNSRRLEFEKTLSDSERQEAREKRERMIALLKKLGAKE